MRDRETPRVLGLGVATLDYLFLSPVAAPGGQARLQQYAIEGGGLVGTAIVAAARLGAQAAIRTWVGDDQAGREVVEEFRREGVDTRRVEVVPGERTGAAFIHVEEGTGERTIYFAGCPRLSPAEAARGTEGPLECDAVVVDAVWPEASLALAGRARTQGIPVVGDFVPEGDLLELAGLMTALIVPRAGAERLAPGGSWEEKLRRLTETGAAFVAVTAGPEGCYFFADGKACLQPAFSVPVVDTTGAGDVFHGAFAYALARRWPVAQCVEFASAVAALSCRALGGRRAIPSYAEAAAFLREHGPGRWEW
jgi:sugar/nucleoside kinase (ribokinase family)